MDPTSGIILRTTGCDGSNVRIACSSVEHPAVPNSGVCAVIILGIILLVLGFIFGIPILWTLGIIIAVIGVILAILGATGRAVGGRAHYY